MLIIPFVFCPQIIELSKANTTIQGVFENLVTLLQYFVPEPLYISLITRYLDTQVLLVLQSLDSSPRQFVLTKQTKYD